MKNNEDADADCTECYSIVKNKLTLCCKCPCDKNKNDTGIHKRVIFHYLKTKQYEEGYFYFQNLISKLVGDLQCDLGSIDFNDSDTSQMTPSCLLFKKNFESFQLLDELAELERSDSEVVQEQYDNTVRKFKFVLMSNLERLTRIALDSQYKRLEADLYFDKGIIFLEKAIEAKEKYNIDVPYPSIIEERFKAATDGPGSGPEQITRRIENEKRLKEAKRRAFLEKMAKEYAKNGKLSKKTEDEFREMM